MNQQTQKIISFVVKLSGKNFFYLAILSLVFDANAAKAQAEWVKQLGGLEGDVGVCSAADGFGHVFTIGTFSGTSSFGNYNISSLGRGDVFVIRSNASTGDIDWVRQIGGNSEDYGNAIGSDPFGNIYCTGRFSGTVLFGTFSLTATGTADAFVAKIDPTVGAVLWAKKMGGSGFDGGFAITSDGLGNIYTTGCYQGTGIFGTFTLNPVGSNLNVFVQRIDATSGSVVWAKGYGSAGYSSATSISCDGSGDVYLTGYFEGETSFGTNTLTAVQYQDVFVSKHYASTGNVVWAFSSGGLGNDSGYGIVAGTDGFVYTTGKFENDWVVGTSTLTSQGSADIFLSRRDALTGSISWVKRFGSQGYDQPNAITRDENGHLFITGQFNGYISFGSAVLASMGNADVFIVKIDMLTGNALMSSSMGGQAVDSGNGITSGPNNALYCTGSFQSGANIGGEILTAKGTADIFIMKLNGTNVGLNESMQLLNSIQLIPVPFEDELRITVGKPNLSAYQLSISDASGKLMLQLESKQTQQNLKLNFLEAGIYFVTIVEETGAKAVKKIIKK